MDDYVVDHCIGEGIHGIVLKCKRKSDNKVVAIKKIQIKNFDMKGLQPATFQEFKTLENIQHKNVVSLLSLFPHGSCLCLVMEYVPKDLSTLIFDSEWDVTINCIKKIFLMLLRGLSYCHDKGIVHRDLKPANLLLTHDGVLKIGDFSQARLFDKNSSREYSHQVATRWYRAPELLYGSQVYDQEVDLWASGCILAELYNRFPLFRGDNDIEQLLQVLQILGTPTEDTWPGVSELPDYRKITFPSYERQNLNSLIPDADELTINLMEKLIIYPPSKRITAAQALLHEYFFSEPLPVLKVRI